MVGVYKCSKGAPHIILRLGGDHAITEVVEKDVAVLGNRGVRCLAVAKTDANGKWVMLGLLTFLDPPRPDTKKTIQDANYYGRHWCEDDYWRSLFSCERNRETAGNGRPHCRLS